MIKKVLITVLLTLVFLSGCEIFMGDPGLSGNDGTIWLTGSGTPAASAGVDGDLYLDILSNDVYEKVGGFWTFLLNIQGEAGLPGLSGAAGAVWLTGTVVPDNADGIDGDFYLDTAASDVYLKSFGAWALLFNIQGLAGVDGIDGTNGTDGSVWYTGTVVPAGALGVDGDYYLNTANGDVYQKSAGTWSLIGNIQGTDGIDGIDGTLGIDGATWLTGSGAPGEIGADGDLYLDELNGDVYQKSGTWSFLVSILGATGTTGVDGTDGADGATWLTGTTHPDDVSTGVDGDFYLETDTGNTYKKVAGVWIFQSNIEGKKEFQVVIQVHSNNNPTGNVELIIGGTSYGTSAADGNVSIGFDTIAPVDIDLAKEFFVAVTHIGVTPQETTNPVTVSLEITPQIFFPDAPSGRIIRIDDMTGANRTEITSVNGTALLSPQWVEVDYDNGWIYVVDDTGFDTLFRIDEFTMLEQNAQIVTLDIATIGAGINLASQLYLTNTNSMYLAGQITGVLYFFPDVEDLTLAVADNIAVATFVSGLTVTDTGAIIWPETQPGNIVSTIRTSSSILNGTAVDFAAVAITQGSGINQLKGPTRLFSDADYLYISDSGDTDGMASPYNHRLVRYNLDGTAPTAYGVEGTGIDQFTFPVLMGLLPDGKLYIMDMGNDRIVRIDSGASFGTGWEEYTPTGVDLTYTLNAY